MVSARRSERFWLKASPPTPSVWPATTKVEPFSFASVSASPRAFTDGIDAELIEAELKSNWISRSMFGLVAAISAICSRSLVDSERVLRLRSPSTKLACFALTSGSICAARAPMESPRVSGLGCNALRICSADTLPSPASANVAVIDSPAQIVIALSPEKLKLVIVVVLVVKSESRPAQRFDAWTIGRVRKGDCDARHFRESFSSCSHASRNRARSRSVRTSALVIWITLRAFGARAGETGCSRGGGDVAGTDPNGFRGHDKSAFGNGRAAPGPPLV